MSTQSLLKMYSPMISKVSERENLFWTEIVDIERFENIFRGAEFDSYTKDTFTSLIINILEYYYYYTSIDHHYIKYLILCWYGNVYKSALIYLYLSKILYKYTRSDYFMKVYVNYFKMIRIKYHDAKTELHFR